jgi:hypothetical protein
MAREKSRPLARGRLFRLFLFRPAGRRDDCSHHTPPHASGASTASSHPHAFPGPLGGKLPPPGAPGQGHVAGRRLRTAGAPALLQRPARAPLPTRLHSAVASSTITCAIVLLYVVAVAALGSLLGRRQKDAGDYFLADHTIPWWAACFSIVATETSALTVISVPATAYGADLWMLQLAAGYVLGRIAIAASCSRATSTASW